MRALLDINILIALLDRQHVHHSIAARWLHDNIDHGWASCPLTQNGCIRILSQSGYPNPSTPRQVAERLTEATSTTWHRFWMDDISLLSERTADWSHILGSRQITDVYLLALAASKNGRFVTLDRKVPVNAAPSASPENLVVITNT